jgi:glycosyltransferase involved in cell wall biosynthesis
MNFALHLPLNSVSFGQVSVQILREIHKRSLEPSIFTIGNGVDLSSQQIDKDFGEWIQNCINKSLTSHDRKTPTIKLWHLNGSLESYSEKQILVTFYELDNPTPHEQNIAKNNTTVLTSKYAQEVFNIKGVKCDHVPLAFDSSNFTKTKKNYFTDGRITFNVVGKLEKRKRHQKTIRAWAKRFGNDKKYFLQCAVYNPFISEQDNNGLINQILEGQGYFNINFLGHMQKNSVYNDFLNSGDIILAMSGGEGWGLPEFHSVGLGKHAIVMNAHSYKEWANKENSILVEPKEKIDCYDGMFFKPDQPFNQGQIFDYDEDEFIHACEEAIKKVESSKINEAGLKIQEDFKINKTVDTLLGLI